MELLIQIPEAFQVVVDSEKHGFLQQKNSSFERKGQQATLSSNIRGTPLINDSTCLKPLELTGSQSFFVKNPLQNCVCVSHVFLFLLSSAPPPWEGIFGSMWRGLFFRINGYNVSTSIFINKVLFIYLSTSHFILLLPAFYFVVEVSYYYIRLRLFIRLIILAEIDIVEIPSSCDSAPQPPSACQIWYLPFVYCNVSTWCSLPGYDKLSSTHI